MSPEDIELRELQDTSSSRCSSDSAVSLAFEEIGAQAQLLPDYEDIQAEYQPPVLGTWKKFKRVWVLGFILVLILGYTGALLSYRSVNSSGRKGYTTKNKTSIASSLSTSTIRPITSENVDISQSSDSHSASSTPEPLLVSLTEKEARSSRDPLPVKHYHQLLTSADMNFLSMSSSKDDDEGLYVVQYEDKTSLKKASDPNFESILVPSPTFEYAGLENIITLVIPNRDATFLLLASEYTKQFRHSAEAYWYIYNVASKEVTPITGGVTAKLEHCSWSPTSSHVTFVQGGDLYLFDVQKSKAIRITNDGSDQIFNGKSDWVYEEEVLFTDSTTWWNDEGTKLAFLRINDTEVETLPLERFNTGVFPTIEKIKYPKPGEPNPRLTMFIYDISQGTVSTVDRGDSKLGPEWVCYGALWVNDSLVIRESDRASKVLDYRVVDDKSTVVYTVDSNKYDGWIENFNDMLHIPKNETSNRAAGFVDIVESQGYNHLAMFTLEGSMKPKVLTSGDWEVLSIDAYDKGEDLLYFSANRESHFESHIYAVQLTTGETFAISDVDNVGYYAGVYSASTRHIVLIDEGPGFPQMRLLDTLEKKTIDKRSVDFTGSRSHYHTIQLADGETVDIIEMLPEKFDESKKHPLLVNVYGGPGYRKLTAQFHAGFEDTVSEKLDAVVLFIDPRGTGGQGWKYRSYSKRHIGHWEPRDVTEATKLWIESRTYIDPEKTAIWGWSYGGFTTLKTMEYDQGNVFKYGMAVSPVTNWLMYDSIYTERYMDQPMDNPEGYKESQIRDVERLKGVKRFALMHGTGDDNVHIQNTFKLIDLFNLHNVVNYDFMVFPDSNHNINYHNSYSVLMERLNTWLHDNFE